MRQPRPSVHRTAPGCSYEVTLVGVGATAPHSPVRQRRRSVLRPSPLPHIDANVLVVPLNTNRNPKRTTTWARRPFWATAETITPRGMLIAASTVVVEENQWVVVEIHPSDRPQSAPPLRVKALVNFVMGGVGFGVRFIAMTDRTRAELDELTQTPCAFSQGAENATAA